MSENTKYVVATDETFQEVVLESEVPVLVDFWAGWCAPCRIIAPVVQEIAEEYEGRAKVVKLDVDANPNVAMNFGIRSIPTLLFFKDGRPVDQLIGVGPTRALTERMDGLVGQPA